MEIVHGEEDLAGFMERAVRVSKTHPVLVDRYLSHATEIDVDVVADGKDIFIGGIQEHIEEAGIHSGDAACVLPAQTLSESVLDEIRRITRKICDALEIVGLMNLQLAVKDDAVYVLEANPRASRTVPYVSKAIGVSLAKVATKVMLGQSLRSMGLVGEASIDHVAVKAPVFPFQRLPGVDTILGPEMKSTGEVMGIDRSLGRAYYKAMVAAGNALPAEGAVYMTVRDEDKPAILPVAARLAKIGLRIYATRGTAQFLREHVVHRIRLVGPGILLTGLVALAWAVARGEASVYLIFVVPAVVGTGPLAFLGILLVFLGFFLTFFLWTTGAPPSAIGRPPIESPETEAIAPLKATKARRWGGVVFLGPIPLVFGSDPQMTRMMLILGVILLFALLLLTVALLLS